MGADVAAVEGGRIARPSGLGQRGEHGFPEAAPRPLVEAVVDRGPRAVGGRAIAPAAARRQHVQDARDDLPVVLALRSGLILGHERSDHRLLLIREPEQVRHHRLQALKRPPGITKRQTPQRLGSVHTLGLWRREEVSMCDQLIYLVQWHGQRIHAGGEACGGSGTLTAFIVSDVSDPSSVGQPDQAV